MPKHPGTQEVSLETAKRLTRTYGTSYYLSMQLFPPRMRDAVYALYGFARTADEIVDTEESDPDAARSRLTAWQHAWHQAVADGRHDDPVLAAAAWVFREYQIPVELGDAFFEAMLMDTLTFRYETYADLMTYMYGSAAVVGRMLTYIIGSSSPEAFPYADDLGYAMQLTNFLRDINEDLQDRGRIYLPLEDLRRFGVSEDDLRAQRMTPEFRELMAFEIERARALYARADTGISLLAPEGQKAVRLARTLYSKILDRIEKEQYDIFTSRVRTTTFQKVRYALPILLKI